MIRLAASVLLAASAALAAPALAGDVTIATARGEVTLPAGPSRVAVFDMAALDTMDALGVVPAGVPDKLYVDYLDDAAGKAAPLGTLFEPNLEAVAALAPDLIVVGARSATQVEALSPLAPTIDMTIGQDLVADARARIAAYGALFGKAEQAAELEAAFDAKLAEARAAVAGKGKALILLTNGPKVSAYGKGSRFGWLHTALGLPEAYENLNPEVHGDAVSFEFIAEVDPEWIIVVDRSSAVGEQASARATLDNPLVAGTRAAREGRMVYLRAAPLYIAGGGYRSVMGTLDEIIAAFAG